MTDDEYNVVRKALADFKKTGKTDIKCPRCGKNLVYEGEPKWGYYSIECESGDGIGNCIEGI